MRFRGPKALRDRLENEVIANKGLIDQRPSDGAHFNRRYRERWRRLRISDRERRACLELLYAGSRAIAAPIEGENTATLNYSLNTHAPDQTGSRPRRLHCDFDLAAPSCFYLKLETIFMSFRGP